MPKLRNSHPAIASAATSTSANSRKRKRANVELAEPSNHSPLSPRQKLRNISHTTRGSPRKKRLEESLKVEEELTTNITAKVNGSIRVEEEVKPNIEKVHKTEKKPPRANARSKGSKAKDLDSDHEDSGGEEEAVKPKRKRKTKEEREAEEMPLAERAVGLKMFVGAHTSIAKGVENAITNCVHIGGNAFACFLKSQRKWENPPLKDENRDAFRKALLEQKYDGLSHIVPHGSYLVNLATEDKDKAKQSYDAFIDDLHRCEALGIRYYNFHPGGAGQSPFEEAITRLANNLNRALSETNTVVPLLENMAGHGTLIGGRFSDLRDVISQIKPEYKSRIGVCIDTCHAFAAGYDLRDPEAFKKTMDEFDQVVGFKYLKAMHLNDSKAPFGSHRDLHQNIGLGFLGLRAFHNVMNEPRFHGLPLILETPCEKPDPKDPKGKKTIEDKSVWATEIKLLESLIGMDPAGDEFKTLEKQLSQRGKKERDEMQAQYDKKLEKEKKKLAKEREKGQKSLSDMFGNQTAKSAGRKKREGKANASEEESEVSGLSDVGDRL